MLRISDQTLRPIFEAIDNLVSETVVTEQGALDEINKQIEEKERLLSVYKIASQSPKLLVKRIKPQQKNLKKRLNS